MSDYKTVMLAVDLTEESLQVAKRATQLVQAYAAELHVVHVIEPLSLAYGGDVPMDLSTVQEQIQEQATSHLREFSAARRSRVPPTPYIWSPRKRNTTNRRRIWRGRYRRRQSWPTRLGVIARFNGERRIARCQLRRFGSSRRQQRTQTRIVSSSLC